MGQIRPAARLSLGALLAASTALCSSAALAQSAVPVLELSYDALGRVKTTKDGNGNASTYFSPGMGLGGYNDPAGGQVRITYDDRDRAIAQTDEVGQTTRSKYDGRGRVTERVYPEGDKVVFGYDDRNNVTSLVRHAKPGSPEAGQTISIGATYDTSWNKPLTITDQRNGVTTYTYVPAGQGGAGEIATVSLPAVGADVSSWSYTYNSFGQPLTMTGPTNMVVRNDYTGAFLSSTTLDYGGANASTTTFTNNSRGDPTQIDGPRTDVSDIINYGYDDKRRKTDEAAPAVSGQRVMTKTYYDYRGQVEKVERGTLVSTTFTVLQTDLNAYDNSGNRIRTETAAGVTQLSYDESNRVRCTAVRMNPEAYGTLPSDACVPSTLGANGPDQISRNTYDLSGRALTVERGVGTGDRATYATYAYSPNGQRTALTDANGNKTEYAYDGFDRLKRMKMPDLVTKGIASTTDYEEYGYDAAGNRTSFRRRDGQVIGYSFNPLNRMSVKDIPGGTSEDVYYSYDKAGRMTSARFGSTGGQGIVTTYDSAGRKQTETSFGRQLTSGYNAAGQRTRLTWPDSFYVEYAYDAAGRLTEVRENGATSGAGLLVTLAYGPLNRRTGISRSNGALTAYAYDVAGRLTALSHTALPNGPSSVQTVSYTPASQISSLNQTGTPYVWTGQPASEVTYTPDNLNRIGNIASLSGGYDARGNLTYDGQRTFTYDVENKLRTSSAWAGGSPMTLTYDPAGRLRQVSSSSTEQLLYDGDALVAEYDSGSSLVRRYVHGTGIDEPLIWYEGSGTSNRNWLHADRQGSIIATSTAIATTTYAYGPYGEPQAWQGSRFRYTGQIALPQAQLYHYRARAYDPNLGRFLQTDPINQNDDPNLYGYVKSDPLNYVDPAGTDAQCGSRLTCSAVEQRINEFSRKEFKADENGYLRPTGKENSGEGKSKHYSREMERLIKDPKKTRIYIGEKFTDRARTRSGREEDVTMEPRRVGEGQTSYDGSVVMITGRSTTLDDGMTLSPGEIMMHEIIEHAAQIRVDGKDAPGNASDNKARREAGLRPRTDHND